MGTNGEPRGLGAGREEWNRKSAENKPDWKIRARGRIPKAGGPRSPEQTRRLLSIQPGSRKAELTRSPQNPSSSVRGILETGDSQNQRGRSLRGDWRTQYDSPDVSKARQPHGPGHAVVALGGSECCPPNRADGRK